LGKVTFRFILFMPLSKQMLIDTRDGTRIRDLALAPDIRANSVLADRIAAACANPLIKWRV
jgi:hypothetical protein